MADRTTAGGDGAAFVATAVAAALIAQQVGGKATRDALFLSTFEAEELPKAMAAAAGLSLLAVLAASRLYLSFGPARVVPAFLTASAALFVGEWWAMAAAPTASAAVVYVHVALFGALAVSGFWSVVNERFDPHAAKRVVARIGGGATFGGVVGGLAAERIAAWTDVRTTLLVLAALNVSCAFGIARFGLGSAAARRSFGADGEAQGALAGVRLVARRPYLRSLAALVLVTSIATSLVDFSLKAHAAAALETDLELLSFFAYFYTATALGTFLLQSLVTRQALERLGLGGTVAVLPAAVVGLASLATASVGLVSVAATRAVQYVLENSFFRSGYELLYTPLAAAEKRPTKTLIDVGLDRLGDAGGSAIILLLLALVPGTSRVVLGVAILVALLGLVASLRLHGGYVAQLAQSLRTGAVSLRATDVVDATTRRTLTETTLALDREKLLEQIREFRTRQGEPSAAPAATDDAPGGAARAAHPVAERAADLLTGDEARVRAALEDPALDPRLVALVVPHLASRTLDRAALEALRRLAPRAVGAVVDALLDGAQPFTVRRRVPRVLREVGGPRAVAGLVAGLSDPRFEVRYQCGRALSAVLAREPGLTPPPERLLEVVERELAVDRTVWQGQRLLDDPDDDTLLDRVVRDRVDRSLEHVFTLLGLVVDRDTVALCFRAIGSGDPALHGTALEYLENVLPPTLRERLWPHVAPDARSERAQRAERQREEIVEDLLRSMEGVPFDRGALREE